MSPVVTHPSPVPMSIRRTRSAGTLFATVCLMLPLGWLSACGGKVVPLVVVPPHERINIPDIDVRVDEAAAVLQGIRMHPAFGAWVASPSRGPIGSHQSLSRWTEEQALVAGLLGVHRLEPRAHQSLLRTLKAGWRGHGDGVCRPLVAGEALSAPDVALVRTAWHQSLAEQDYQGLLKALRDGAVATLENRPARVAVDASSLSQAHAAIDASMRRWHGAGWRQRLTATPWRDVDVGRCEAMADLMLAAENLPDAWRAALLAQWFSPDGAASDVTASHPVAPLRALW
jgi:hypothetical protein